MKSFLRINLFFSLLLVLFSCVQGQTTLSKKWMEQNGKIKVLSTIEMLHDLVIAIGGEHVDSLALISGGIDPHSYEMVKGDAEKFSCADIVFYNGLGLEHGASLVNSLQSHENSLAVGDVILKKYPDKALYIEGTLDPHIWMDISLWKEAVDPIVTMLSKKNPRLSFIFQKNGKKLKAKLMQAHLEIFAQIQAIDKEKRYLVTSHDAFNYFARSYLIEKDQWQERFNAPEGLAPDGQLSPVNIQNLIAFIKKYNIQVLFPESNVSKDSIYKILLAAKKMQINLKIAKDDLYGDAMQFDPSLQGENYINTMKHNAHIISRYLQ